MHVYTSNINVTKEEHIFDFLIQKVLQKSRRTKNMHVESFIRSRDISILRHHLWQKDNLPIQTQMNRPKVCACFFCLERPIC